MENFLQILGAYALYRAARGCGYLLIGLGRPSYNLVSRQGRKAKIAWRKLQRRDTRLGAACRRAEAHRLAAELTYRTQTPQPVQDMVSISKNCALISFFWASDLMPNAYRWGKNHIAPFLCWQARQFGLEISMNTPKPVAAIVRKTSDGLSRALDHVPTPRDMLGAIRPVRSPHAIRYSALARGIGR